MKRTCAGGLLAAILLAAGPAVGAEISGLDGEALFARLCASCHGPAGRGDGPVAPGLDAAVPDLTRLTRDHGGSFPAEHVRQTIDGRFLVITHGPRRMPVWGYRFWMEEGADAAAERRARERIDRLVDYVRTLQDVTDPRLPPPVEPE